MAMLRRFSNYFRGNKLRREIEAELRAHTEMRIEDNMAAGMSPEEARRDALLRLGNPSLLQERMSEIDLMILPQTILQDLRYGARILCRNAGFTAVSVFALAIGIGVNTAAFTAYKAFFLRPLDGPDSGQMVNIVLHLRSGDLQPLFSYPDYQSYLEQSHSFSGLIASSFPESLRLSVTGGIVSQPNSGPGTLMQKSGMLPRAISPETALTFLVSDNYFSALGVRPIRGRLFQGETSSPTVLISENYWQKRFAGDPKILGKIVHLNGSAFTVAGITPHNFVGTSLIVPDFWLPLSSQPLIFPDDDWLRDRENLSLHLYGRLAPGRSIAEAQTEMTLLAHHLGTLHDPHSELAKPATALLWPGSPFPLPMKQYTGLRYAILLIMTAVGMVLVIACANVASLQLARAASRQKELSMRLSLGASRVRIIRQLLTESALLGMLAGLSALLASWAMLQVLVAVAQSELPASFGSLVYHVSPDLGIFAYAFLLSLLAGVLFGLAPALESSGAALSSVARAGSGTSPIRSRRLRDFLMALQVTVSLVLMIAGAMLIRSSIRALKTNTGYDGKQIISLNLQFPEGPNYDTVGKASLVRELRARLSNLPGAATITSAWAPDGNGLRTAAVSLNGEKPSPQNTKIVLYYTYVQSNYFQTLGIPLVIGRGFSRQGDQPEPAVILSESTAQLLWPGQNPIGRTLRLGTDGQFHGKGELFPDGPAYQVIGIARDTRGILMDGSDAEQIYIPLPQNHIQDYPILIRTNADPTQLMNSIESVMSSIDPDLVATASTLDDLLRTTPSFVAASFSAAIASTVGLLGLFLASMGIYGTVSYIVVLRTREVGIRMALGANKRDIMRLMLVQGMRPVFAGLLVGMSLAVGVSYLLRGVLYGLSGVDSISFLGVSTLFLAIGLLASYIPSRRAIRVEPVVALRYE
jgi:predicted permease